jgi:hypothetical protein
LRNSRAAGGEGEADEQTGENDWSASHVVILCFGYQPMKRRTLLQLLAAACAALPARVRLFAQPTALTAADQERLHALATVVLPTELGPDGRRRVVDRFLAWLTDYRPNAETDHGYGFTRLRRTAPAPVAKYPAQLAAMGDLRVDGTRAVEQAIRAAGIERLPARPDGGHVATDLMAFYFGSAEANDLAYRAAIGRDACRGLAGSERRPTPLAGGSI